MTPKDDFTIRANSILLALSEMERLPVERRAEVATKAAALISDLLRYREDFLSKVYDVYAAERQARG